MKFKILAAAVAMSLGAGHALANDRFVDVIVSLNGYAGPGQSAQNQAAAAAVARGHGVQATHYYNSALSGFAARVPEARLQQLQNDPRVASVEIDQPVWLARPPWEGGGGGGGGSGQTTPWGVERVGGVQANTGAGIRVYVLDTGIDGGHRDLDVRGGFAVEACKGRGCTADWHDDHGHGTHVAGTVGALDNDVDVVGVAPGVHLYAVKVLNKNGSGTRSGVIAGVDWVTSQAQSLGAPVIANMSLGGSGSKSGTCSSGGFSGTDTYHEALCNSARAGVVYAVAAGNDGGDAANAVPAAYDDAVITVSATNSSDDWTSWSNWGNKSASWTSNNSAPVGIAAPGASILSTRTGGGTTTMSGTSMASPHVAGGLALALKKSPQSANYSAFTNLRSSLLNTAESNSNFSNTSGKPHSEDFLNTRSY
jgi:subtilisin